jgi:hypothetical protein
MTAYMGSGVISCSRRGRRPARSRVRPLRTP